MPELDDRWRSVVERVNVAARAAGRDAGQVKLIAVSKRQPAEKIARLAALGQRHFGESTLQDAMTKIPRFEQDRLIWHFVGHLQSNKARSVAAHFSWVHSVDTLKLAQRLSEAATGTGRSVDVLLQVNLAADRAKYGLSPDEVFPMTERLLGADLSGVRLRGLMTIGPRTLDSRGQQALFAGMRELQQDCAGRFGAEWFAELSMGMSDDFELAVREGATMVRVGTAIFGPRG